MQDCITTDAKALTQMSSLKGPTPQKSIFVQESPNELKFAEYVDTSSE